MLVRPAASQEALTDRLLCRTIGSEEHIHEIRVVFIVIIAWGVLATPSFAVAGENVAPPEDLFAAVQGEPLTDEEAQLVDGEGIFQFLFARKGKNKKPKKPKKRERNTGHPDGEEHSRRHKGPRQPPPQRHDGSHYPPAA